MMKSFSNRTGLDLRVAKDYQAMSRLAAEFIEGELRVRPDLILCASGGGSPTGTYASLGERCKRNPKLFRKLRVLQIDEWGGLDPQDPGTCRMDVKTKLLTPLGITGKRFEGFRTDAPDPQRDAERIARWLAKNGPIDICVLGLGLNGHIAMNEPEEELIHDVHVATLAPQSLNHGMLKHLAVKPRYGLTLGMGDILRSRKILLVVSGEPKRAVFKRLLDGKVSTRFPASFLWLHSAVTIICDRDATS